MRIKDLLGRELSALRPHDPSNSFLLNLQLAQMIAVDLTVRDKSYFA